jgi:hypothetical protein
LPLEVLSPLFRRMIAVAVQFNGETPILLTLHHEIDTELPRLHLRRDGVTVFQETTTDGAFKFRIVALRENIIRFFWCVSVIRQGGLKMTQ